MTGSKGTSARVGQIARDVLGFASLRPAQQEAAVALASGRDCLAILPSGAGKSAIYQIAAIALGVRPLWYRRCWRCSEIKPAPCGRTVSPR